jgi:hypothetical protein
MDVLAAASETLVDSKIVGYRQLKLKQWFLKRFRAFT